MFNHFQGTQLFTLVRITGVVRVQSPDYTLVTLYNNFLVQYTALYVRGYQIYKISNLLVIKASDSV